MTVVLTTSIKLSTIAEWLWVHIKSLGTVFADAFHGGDSEDDLYEEPARKPRRKKASKSEPELDNGPGDDGSPFLTPPRRGRVGSCVVRRTDDRRSASHVPCPRR